MKIGQPIAHFRVEDGKPAAVPLPFAVQPLPLRPEVAALIARLLAGPVGSDNAASGAAKPIVGSHVAAQVGLAGHAPPPQPGDWSSLLFLRQSVLGPGMPAGRSVPATVATQPTHAPLDTKSWLLPKPFEGVKRDELQPLSPGLWLRPLPVSPATLANASHLLAATQIGLETLKPLGFEPSFSSPLNTALDGGTAVVALAEIVQETARPTAHGLKRLLYYMKRLLYIAKFVTDVAPVSPAVQHSFTVVGLIVKGTGELHSIRLTASGSRKPS